MLHACWGCVPPVRTRRLPPKPAKPEPNRDFERTPPSAVRALAKGAVIIPRSHCQPNVTVPHDLRVS